MNAVATQRSLLSSLVPFLWIVVALLIGFLMVDLASAAGPMPPQEPAPVFIVSPWTGTFYAREYEGGKSFVAVGSKVEPHTIVCIVEAMKQFRIPAGMEGTIVEVLVTDNQMINAGQPLFKVQPVRPPGKPWESR